MEALLTGCRHLALLDFNRAILLYPFLLFIVRYLVKVLAEVIAFSLQQLLVQYFFSFFIQSFMLQNVLIGGLEHYKVLWFCHLVY